MKRLPVFVLLVVALSSPNLAGRQASTTQAKATSVRYGANPAAGHSFTHDGVRLYYEVYGAGEPVQLAIFPNATHMIPFDDPATFNATVERFLRAPFVNKDRIKDMLASLEKLRASSTPHPQ
jgi:hypothetical protein